MTAYQEGKKKETELKPHYYLYLDENSMMKPI